MGTADKSVRQSISLPSRLASKVRRLAKNQRASTNRVLVDLIEAGIDSRENQRCRFFELTEKLSASSDPDEQRRIKKELARLTFGG
jgi:metal-responsive CopG/Arc/MetJ family transcriptional regulator